VAAGATAPWEVVTAVRAPRRATRDLVAEMCMQLEQQGLDAAEPNLLLACFQEAGDFTPATRSRYEFLATRAACTGALGHGMPVAPVAGVRGADLAAKDLGDDGPDAERRYDVAVTHDRDLVIRAAEPLLRRLVPGR
jgi:hypothetical protein